MVTKVSNTIFNNVKANWQLGPCSWTQSLFAINKTFAYLSALTDFPGLCFASTKCATVEPGHTWELSPFCGRSTCVQGEGTDRLLELVEDCGPYPKSNPKCKLSEKTNKTASFPECCPVFDCEPGVKLEYPEVTVVENSESSDSGADAATSTTTEKTKAWWQGTPVNPQPLHPPPHTVIIAATSPSAPLIIINIIFFF